MSLAKQPTPQRVQARQRLSTKRSDLTPQNALAVLAAESGAVWRMPLHQWQFVVAVEFIQRHLRNQEPDHSQNPNAHSYHSQSLTIIHPQLFRQLADKWTERRSQQLTGRPTVEQRLPQIFYVDHLTYGGRGRSPLLWSDPDPHLVQSRPSCPLW